MSERSHETMPLDAARRRRTGSSVPAGPAQAQDPAGPEALPSPASHAPYGYTPEHEARMMRRLRQARRTRRLRAWGSRSGLIVASMAGGLVIGLVVAGYESTAPRLDDARLAVARWLLPDAARNTLDLAALEVRAPATDAGSEAAGGEPLVAADAGAEPSPMVATIPGTVERQPAVTVDPEAQILEMIGGGETLFADLDALAGPRGEIVARLAAGADNLNELTELAGLERTLRELLVYTARVANALDESPPGTVASAAAVPFPALDELAALEIRPTTVTGEVTAVRDLADRALLVERLLDGAATR